MEWITLGILVACSYGQCIYVFIFLWINLNYNIKEGQFLFWGCNLQVIA